MHSQAQGAGAGLMFMAGGRAGATGMWIRRLRPDIEPWEEQLAVLDRWVDSSSPPSSLGIC